MGNNNEIGKAFKEKLSHLSESPDQLVWENIIANIDQKPTKNYKGIALVALLLLPLCLVIILNTTSKQNNEENRTLKTITKQKTIKNNSYEKIVTNSSIKKGKNVTVHKKFRKTYNHKIKNKRDIVTASRITPQKIKLLNPKKDSLSIINKKIKALKLDKKEKSPSRFSISINTGLNYFSSNSIKTLFDKDFGLNYKRNFHALQYGFTVNYQLNKKNSLRVGLHRHLIKQGYNNILISSQNEIVNKIASNPSIIRENISNENLLQFLDSSSKIHISNNLEYFELPIEFKRQLIGGKYNLYLIGGYSLIQLYNNKVLITNNHDKQLHYGYNSRLNKFNSTFNLGFSTQYKIHKKVSFNLEVFYKQHLNLLRNSSQNKTPFMVSLQTGVIYKF